MKKIIPVLLVVLIAAGWASALLSNSSTSNAYEEYLETARDYVDRGLYEMAIQKYDSAISVDSTNTAWEEKMAAYALWYEEDTGCYSDYLEAAVSAIAAKPKVVSYVITAAELYMINDSYESAVKVIEAAQGNGLESDDLSALLLEAKYAYSIGWRSYDGVGSYSEEYYPVMSGETWTYIEADGSTTDYEDLLYAGPVGDDGMRLVQDETRAFLIDEDDVVQGILDFEPDAAGVYAEGLIAISKDGSYGYYNSLGDYQFGDYDEAGTFTDGKAAVKDGDVWYLIDTTGAQVSEETYDDIVLCEDGTYILDDVMIASQNGVYSIYTDGEASGSYEDADLVTKDGIIAVLSDGLWGYVNLKGEEIIAPTYEAALSFSNGMAAVCIDEKWGFINEDGTLVIEAIFYGAGYFNDEGCCMMETADGTQWQLIELEAGI